MSSRSSSTSPSSGAAARLEAQRKIAIQREAYRRTAAEWARAKEAVEEAARATAARSAAAAAEAGVLAAGGAASDVEVEVNAVVRGVAVHAHAEAHVPAHSSSGGSGAGAGAGAGSGNTSSSSSSSAAPHVAATATVSPTLPIGFPALPPEPDWSALQSALPAVPAPPAMTPEVYAAQACQECGASYCDPAPTYLQAVTADGTVADGAVSAVPPRVPVHALSVLQVTLRNSTDDPAAYLEELGITPEYIESCLCNHHHQHTHEHGHGSSSGSGGAGAGEGEGAGSGSAAASAASPSEQVTMAHAVHHRDLRQQTLANGYAGFAPVLGVVYDERMLLHQDPRDAKPPRPSLSQSLAGVQLPPAASSPHPERPDRLRSIAQHLVATGLFQRCKRVAARDVAREEVLGVHEEGYAEAVDELPDKVAEHDGAFTFDRSDTYANPYTYQAAKLACGSVLAVTEAVLRGQLDRGVALVRPPGHHAEPDAAMGFCIYNNVAVAAAAARKKWGARRVLIVDWDVHHGNGTESMFYDDPSVLFFSTHRYEHGSFYPGTGHPYRVGNGAGAGYNINVAWNGSGNGDAEYLAAWDEILMPIAHSFNPDLVIVSAGFDAAAGDPLGGYNITPAGYAHMTHRLLSLARGRVVVALEGGYNLESISNSMEWVVRVLLGQSPPPLYVPPTRVHAKPSAAAASLGGEAGELLDAMRLPGSDTAAAALRDSDDEDEAAASARAAAEACYADAYGDREVEAEAEEQYEGDSRWDVLRQLTASPTAYEDIATTQRYLSRYWPEMRSRYAAWKRARSADAAGAGGAGGAAAGPRKVSIESGSESDSEASSSGGEGYRYRRGPYAMDNDDDDEEEVEEGDEEGHDEDDEDEDEGEGNDDGAAHGSGRHARLGGGGGKPSVLAAIAAGTYKPSNAASDSEQGSEEEGEDKGEGSDSDGSDTMQPRAAKRARTG